MSNTNSDKEISLLDLLVHFYLFIKRKKQIILFFTILFLVYGIIKNLNFKEPENEYEAEIEISSLLIKKELVQNAILKLFIIDKTYRRGELTNLGFPKEILSDLVTIKNPKKNLDNDSTMTSLIITLKNKTALDNISKTIIQIITNQDSIRSKSLKIEKFKKEYLLKVSEKIIEIENYNKLLIANLSDKSTNLLNSSNYSNRELFVLIQEKLQLELNKDEKPISYKLINLKELNNIFIYTREVLLFMFLGICIGLLISFIQELLQQIKSQAQSNEKAS